MNFFNRIVVLLLLLCLFVVGLFAFLYGFQIGGYSIYDLPGQARESGFWKGTTVWARGLNSGTPGVLMWVICVAVIITGLILLFLELRRGRPRNVILGNSTYITKQAVESEVRSTAMNGPEISDAHVKVKSNRSPGASIMVDSKIRRGADLQSTRESLREMISARMADIGIPVRQLKVKAEYADPRKAQVRVK